MMSGEELIPLLPADKRPRMKNKRLRIKAKRQQTAFEFLYGTGNLHALIVEYHAHNIEAGIFVWILKAPRLVHKYT
jgi:hypothetical protein